jgi:hypothetical protein
MYGALRNVDIMTINHFIIWLVLGYLFPNLYIIAFILSIIWELFERFIVTNQTLYKFIKKYWFVPERYWNEKSKNSIIDIIINMIGYWIGSKLHFT